MKKENLEFQVGIFVIVALLALAVLTLKAGDFYLKPGYTIRLVLDSVNGIEKGSSIRLSGVPIGDVMAIRAVRADSGETHVEAEAHINQGVFIEQDAQLRVATMGFLGEKFIEILPGTPGAKTLVAGDVLEGKKYSNVDDLFDSGQRLINQMQAAVGHVNEVVADPEFKASVKGTFAQTDRVTKNLAEASDDLKDAAKSAKIVLARMRDGEGTIGKLLKDDKVAKDLEAFVADIKKNPWKLLKKG